MNYYERIQRAIDYIEKNLGDEIFLDDVAKEAYMSLANLYRMFFALVGYPVKEYIRMRRISNACKKLRSDDEAMIDIAFDSGFGSQEAFIKMFKKIVGVTPGSYKKGQGSFSFNRVNVLDRFFDVQDPDITERYPDIKVLKDIKSMRVAYYRHISKKPEFDAWYAMQDWIKRNGIDEEKHSIRYFGFNNPGPQPGREEYGYEVWATIDDEVIVSDDLIKEKVFKGGSYAVTGTTVKDVQNTWKRISEWLKHSKYTYNEKVQWLEEHLLFSEIEEDIKLDIYIPIKLKIEK